MQLNLWRDVVKKYLPNEYCVLGAVLGFAKIGQTWKVFAFLELIFLLERDSKQRKTAD